LGSRYLVIHPMNGSMCLCITNRSWLGSDLRCGVGLQNAAAQMSRHVAVPTRPGPRYTSFVRDIHATPLFSPSPSLGTPVSRITISLYPSTCLSCVIQQTSIPRGPYLIVFIPARGAQHNQQFTIAQLLAHRAATTDMAPSQAPFLYSAVHSDSRFPEPKFDPKAVTRASWEPPKPRKKPDGPLVSFNTHPE
jgi:hypothetical protein